MSKPSRLPSVVDGQTYFVGSSTWQKRSVFQAEPLAHLFLDTLFSYRDQQKYRIHAFVLMPDHFHLIITPDTRVTLERAMQFIKGGFSYRAKTELKRNIEIWQRGFTDRRIRRGELLRFVDYIHENPVRARLSSRPEDYPYSSAHKGFQLDPAPDLLSG